MSSTTGRFELHVLSDQSHLAISQKHLDQCLLLERNATGPNFLMLEDAADLKQTHGRSLAFDAIFGIYTLLKGRYLALVTKSKSVGKVRGLRTDDSDVDFRQVLAIELVLLPTHEVPHLTAEQLHDEERYIAMLTTNVESQLLYFAYDYDLTHSLQRIATLPSQQAIAERADTRFCWNYPASTFLLEKKLFEWVVPIMKGYIDVAKSLTCSTKSFDIVYISRLSCRRQGTRFTMRGIDEDGNVANFVETEQACLFSDGRQTSFVQIRGSIPLHWSSPVTMKYAPKVYQRANLEKDTLAFSAHVTETMKLYGRVIMVNLIDKKKEQLRLGEAFEKVFGHASASNTHILANARYVWFDFHHECRKMQWHNLSKLIQQVDNDFLDYGYFSKAPNGQVLTTQSGVVRTNCMDNLDRTNVVQSLFARRSLLLQANESIDGDVLSSPFPAFEVAFKNLWGNNADAISLLYAGTGALKTDFTRTGKRTKKGVLQDVYNSCLRYLLNNFVDGQKQDSQDLLLQRYVPSRAKQSPFVAASVSLPWVLSTLTTIVFAVFVGLLFWDRHLGFLFERLVHASSFVGLVVAMVFGYVLKKGTKMGEALVTRPALRPQDGCSCKWP
ncbi:phosphatidylinositide phosphatase SAC1-like protein [Achlya hypogyna]|uniref:Phosphatidylinositide phosphatase SAC1-like protein n=1 Tax=Achlya hypogyna TaxID=1202772 RepID=A0A1V9Z4K0_ACHHY|nr:phosphatidylinositide phosphatase SAC1-like protein [Achlya hypogyna]